MKKAWVFYAVLFLGASGLAASTHYDNLAKLIKSGASEEVVITYINTSDSSYNLSSDEIVHLKEFGASSRIIVAAIQHKGTSSAQVTPIASPSPRYEIYQEGPYWRPWRGGYWYPKNFDKLNQAFQVDVAGLFEGAFSVNYEYLLARRHGLVLKGSYYDGWGLGSHGESGELDYRWHLSPGMNSSFIGAFINFGKNSGNVADLWYNSEDTGRFVQRSITIGPDIGKRWVSPWGFSLAAQIGYGYTWSRFDNPVPDQSTQDKLQWLTGFNYEVSIGYAF
jgi:hypothetical protein